MENNEYMIAILRKLFAGEIVSAYHYYYSYKIFEGMNKYAVFAEEFKKHFKEEMNHADKLMNRLVALGGAPIEFLSGLELESPCKIKKFGATFEEIVNSLYLLEKCGVKEYNNAIEIAKKYNDYSTSFILSEILITEEEHLKELFKIL